MMSMNISRVYNVFDVYKTQKSQPRSRISRAEEKIDSIAISSQATDMQSVKKALDGIPDVRMDKINEIKNRIDNNQYFVSSQDIADKLMKKFEN